MTLQRSVSRELTVDIKMDVWSVGNNIWFLFNLAKNKISISIKPPPAWNQAAIMAIAMHITGGNLSRLQNLQALLDIYPVILEQSI